MSAHCLSSQAVLSGKAQLGPATLARQTLSEPRSVSVLSTQAPPRVSSVSRKWLVSAAWGLPNLMNNQSSQPSTPATNAAASSPASSDPPTVSDTKAAFLQAYPLPIPAIYNTVIQELLVQQHLTRYTRSYKYDPVFALGFVTVYDQLMDGYPSPDQREPIFKAYIQALQEDPAQYRADAERLEKWVSELPSASALVEFTSRDGAVESELKSIASRAQSKSKDFHYSRFFAVGLFRLLELAKASDPAVLGQLCEALGVNKMSVNRDLDVYRGLLSKLTQAKDLLRDFLKREKEKAAARQEKAAQRETAKTE